MKTIQTIIIFTGVTLLTLKTNYINAQGGYISIGAGYALSAASQSYGEKSSGSNSDIKLVKGTLGKGINVGATFGTMINANVGIELSAGYLVGGKLKSSYSFQSGVNYDDEISLRMLRLIPALKLTTGADKTKAYARGGVVVGLLGNGITKSNDKDQSGTEIREEKFTGGVSIGFMGAMGAEFAMSAKSAFFTELCFIAQSWAPSKSKITKYTEDGDDLLSTLTVHEQQTEYSNHISSSSSSVSTANEPAKALKVYLPMSSVGINVGVRFMLGGK